MLLVRTAQPLPPVSPADQRLLPGLRLIGFKDRDKYLRFEETIKHSYFIYPSETVHHTDRKSVV